MGVQTQEVIWRPQPGPQTALIKLDDLHPPVFEAFYGGARGGGKTDGMLGDWVLHASKYGSAARGVFFRRRAKALEQAIERSHQLFTPLGARFIGGNQLEWRFPDAEGKPERGAVLTFRHLWDKAAADEYLGHSYCVAVGTRIRMADGRLRAIERIQPGDEVQTLEGPRRVTATLEPYEAECVEAKVFGPEGYRGSQVHPVDHPILSIDGVHCERSPGSRRTSGQFRVLPFADASAQGSPCGGHRGSGGWLSWSGGDRTGCRGSAGAHPARQQPGWWCDQIVLHVPRPRSGGGSSPGASSRSRSRRGSVGAWWSRCRGWLRERQDLVQSPALVQSALGLGVLAFASSPACALRASRTAPDSRSGCPSGGDCGDALARFASESGQVGIRRPGDAEARRRAPTWDATGTTPRRSRLERRTYRHPYTGEARDLVEDFEVGSVEMRPCGSRWVTDLTVEGANHYISEHGAVNVNTRVYFEELPQWPTPDAIDRIRATIRSAAGVKCGMRSTGNPGGPGHNWVKARYIDPCPTGYRRLTDSKTGHDFVFIPARLEDNRILMENDPGYESRMMASGPQALVEAWRWGNWNIVAGGFFDRVWNPERQVLKPFAIPPAWRFRRSLDWGSAQPSSVGFWAITDGEPLPEHHLYYPGMRFPKGSLIRVGEWYTVARGPGGEIKPNVGLQLTNEELGAGIWERSIGRSWTGCVADPSIWTQSGGRSIYQQMQDGAARMGGRLNFLRADNTRIAGWQVMTSMLEESGKPVAESRGLWVFETCEQFIRTVPVLQMDERRPDDVDTDSEDHVADDTRYAAMSAAKSGGSIERLVI